MFDLKSDNQLTSFVAAIAAGAILLTGAAAAAAAEVRESDRYDATSVLAVDRVVNREADAAKQRAARRERNAERKQRQAKRKQRQAKRKRAAAATGPIQGVPRATLDAIAACESGGNPRAVNAAGYYGKYQFSIATWNAVGGKGNPAEASEAEQDLRAAILYNRAGPGQWPVCGL